MQFLRYLLVVAFLFFIFTISFTSSNDFSQDLGRHLKIGEIIWKTKEIPKTNLFSYTNPQFPFINHHWLSEVMFYSLSSFFGVNSLAILKTFLILISVGIAAYIGIKKSGTIHATIVSLIVSPLLLERLNVRPEVFSYVLFAFMLYIIFNCQKNNKLLYFVPLILLLWVNLHITFVFGIFLTLILIVQTFNVKRLTFIPILSLLALLINPNGVYGAVYPFTIFGNYGYSIVENQNLFFLSSATFNPLIKYFFFISPLVVIALIILFIRSKFIEFLILLTFFILAFWQIRHLPFFILATIATAPVAIKYITGIAVARLGKERATGLHNFVLIAIGTAFIVLSILSINNIYYSTFDTNRTFGVNFLEDGKKSAEFMKKNKLPGNVFNNFDIGGYFIYQLYPEYRVFIDNRPEAYPADFVENIYKGLQLNDELRREVFKKYNIRTIYLAHTDQTPWAENFIANIYKDRAWKLIYTDHAVVILTPETKLPDLRDNGNYFKKLIKNEANYLNLLRITRLMSLFDKPALAEEALEKANFINPSSCTIKNFNYRRFSNNPILFGQAAEIKNSSWWCF